jgi:outer membrane immunogenic protein
MNNKLVVAFDAAKALLLTAAISFAVAANAYAADLGTPAAAPAPMYTKAPPLPVWSWTGFYVGGNVGYSWGRGHSYYNDPNFANNGAAVYNPLSQRIDGVIGGGQIGYNWQMNATWLLGLEADIQGSGEKGSASFSDPYSVGTDCDIFCSTVSGTMSANIDWFGTLRGRVGMLVTPTVLLYGTGGLAYGGIKASGTVTNACFSGRPPACVAGSWGFSSSATNVGWTAGAGVEGYIPNTTSWSWKVEYLYLDLGSVSGTGFEPSGQFGPLAYSWSTRVTDNIVRAGLNYHFR